jgi:hypothetical protein
MSQRRVQLLIGQIVTDGELRKRFLDQPADTLAALCDQGAELTALEIDALMRTDRLVWEVAARRIHPRLQRCSLRPDCCD